MPYLPPLPRPSLPSPTTPPQLSERTLLYGHLAMWVCSALPSSPGSTRLADQLFRSATAVAANYAEASDAESPSDFTHKIKIALKELKESVIWLRFAKSLLPDPFLDGILAEAQNLKNLLGASLRTARARLSARRPPHS